MAIGARSAVLLILVWLAVLPVPVSASDKADDQVRFGRSITVGENDDAGDLVCIGCSIRVDGTAHDTVVVGGSAAVNGTLHGDMVTVGGSVDLGEHAVVDGDLVTVGGSVHRNPSAIVHGSVSRTSGIPVFLGLVLVPLIPIILIIGLVVWLLTPNRRRAQVRA